MTAHAQEDARTKLILQINFFWRIGFALLAVAGIGVLWTDALPKASLLVKSLLTLALLSAAVISVVGAVQISRRNHAGRMISLVLDYLAFVVSAVIALNTGEVFIGIDALGQNFGKGIPYLGIIIAGYFLGTLDDYFPQKKQTSETSLKAVSRWVMLGGFVFFLWQVGAVN